MALKTSWSNFASTTRLCYVFLDARAQKQSDYSESTNAFDEDFFYWDDRPNYNLIAQDAALRKLCT